VVEYLTHQSRGPGSISSEVTFSCLGVALLIALLFPIILLITAFGVGTPDEFRMPHLIGGEGIS
jgi:hypothetical protein